ncbi:nose resistant to fluoxetine protein 6-like [Uloborus diversus]|uniref:nose resistant to fluoxetine protein 6-like n=1 Tax=Uloborus diversus TaxID=327109 RepID=UPI00240A913D|nr:nose resistant to fluoxetine protein 6-like [Uloborus diversus]
MDWSEVVDATGKPPSGVFQGTSMSLGDFDECLDVRVGRKGRGPTYAEEEFFHGKYCTVECKLPKGITDAIDEYENAEPFLRTNTSIGRSQTFLNMLLKYGQYMKIAAFRFGVCIPSTCGVDDLSSIVSTISKQIGFPLNVLHCQEKMKVEFRMEQMVIIIVLVSIVLVVLFCTAAEILLKRMPANPTSKIRNAIGHVCDHISAIRSTERLMQVSTDDHPFPILRGLFLLTIVLNILGHTYLMYNHLFFFKYSSVVNYYEYMQQFSFTIIANGSNGVENYFFIAGFLTTYIRWKNIVKKPEMNISKLLLKPYIRMTFFQLLAIALFLLLPLIGYGPFWNDFVGPYLQNCRERWWPNLFYVQNYWASEDACLYHTWLMAAVMQLYVISVIIIWFLIKRPNIGITLIILVVICGMAIVGGIVFVKKLPGALSMYFLDQISGPKMWNSLYIQTFDHAGPFSIGLVTGYVVAKHKHNLKFKTVSTMTLFWCIALASVLAVMFGLYEYRYGNIKMNSSLAILYAMLNRNVYTLFLAWFVIACVTDNAGFLPSLLSWKAFIPAYRLSFLAYLLHLIVIYYHIGILRERVYLSHEENIINYFGYLVTSFLLAYICYIFFQVPYQYFESLVLRKSSQAKHISTPDVEKNLKYKFNDVNNLSLSSKSLKQPMQTLAASAKKDGSILDGISHNGAILNRISKTTQKF